MVLGSTTVTINGYELNDPDWRRERVRALVAWLIVHRRGTRDQLIGALWPDLDVEKGSKNLRTTLSYVHKLLEPRRSSRDATWFVQVDGPNVRLNPQVEVDVWRFTELLDEAENEQRAGRMSALLPIMLEALELYHVVILRTTSIIPGSISNGSISRVDSFSPRAGPASC